MTDFTHGPNPLNLTTDDLAARSFTSLLTAEPGSHRLITGTNERAKIVYEETKRLLERAGLLDQVLMYAGFRELRFNGVTVRIVGSFE